MPGVEELRNNDYRNKEFKTTLKQMTTQETADRRRYQLRGNKKGQRGAIISLNPDQPDLYGLS
jgi:hypothetical protein